MERLEIEILAKIENLEKNLNAAQARLTKFGQAAEDLGKKFSTILTLPILALGAASIKAFGDIQSLKNGLTAVTGSAEETAKQFVRLQQLAKLPGLGLNEVAKGSINLQTIGFSAAKAEKSMAAFGNAVATVGKGRAEFEHAIYGLQQLANTDFPLGEDLNIIKDAIPQVTPLLKEAFGSSRSDELQKLGVTSAQVVDTIVNGLSKLPAVTGGINGGFENLKDGVVNNLARIGEVIDRELNISGIIDSVVNTLTKLVDKFAELSPVTQRIILIFGGIVAAIGPLLLAIGFISTTLIPTLVSGVTVLGTAFAAITGPIALIAIAIAAAVALIVYNWDSIVAYFTTGDGVEVFSELKNVFDSSIKFIQALWKKFTSFLSEFWDEWGGTIIKIAKYYFGIVSTYFKAVFAVISGIFQAATAALNGDWSKFGEIILNTTKKVFNAILSIITSVVKAAGSLVAKFFNAIGLEKFGKGIEDINNAIQDTIKKKFSFDIKAEADVKVNGKKVEDTGAVEADKEKVNSAKAASAEINDIYTQLAKDLQKNAGNYTLRFIDKPEKIEADYAAYRTAIDGLLDNGIKPAAKAIQDLQAKINALVPAATSLGQIPQIDLKKQLGLKDVVVTPNLTIRPITNIVDLASNLNKEFEKVSQSILNSGIQDAFASIGNSIGETLANGGNLLQTLGSGLLSTVGSIATQLGKAAIGVGIAMVGIKKAFANPLTAIAAGVALVAIGSYISGKVSKMTQGGSSNSSGPITKFANGGIISGPTYGLMGEYAGARNNPEVVAPLNKLKGMLGDRSANNTIIPEARIGNDAIYIAYKRGEKASKR